MLPTAAPLPVIDPSPPLTPELETLIGETVASATLAAAVALQGWRLTGDRDGEPFANLIVRMYELRCETAGAVDFMAAANRYGRSALHARCGAAITDHIANELIEFTLDIFERAVALAVN